MMLKILLKILLDFFIENGVKIGMDQIGIGIEWY